MTHRLGSPPIWECAGKGDMDFVRLHLATGTNVNEASIQGATSLSIASFLGQLEMVQLLLAAQARVDQAENNGYTPLCNASGFPISSGSKVPFINRLPNFTPHSASRVLQMLTALALIMP